MAMPVDTDARRAALAEQALLGGLMLDNKDWGAVRSIVNETHIQRADHQLIFRAIAKLSDGGGPADGVLVCIELGELLEAAGGSDYIASLVEATPSAASVRAYGELVREFANRNKVVDITDQIAARARLGGANDAIEHARDALGRIDLGQSTKPLEFEFVSQWASKPPPAPRDWVLEGLIPAGKVTSLIGNGGLGKTLVALQIGLLVSLGKPVFGIPSAGGPVLGIFCEDDRDEIDRRLRAACEAEQLTLADADRFVAISREGDDNIICTFERDRMVLEPFYRQLEATVQALRPRLLIIDTAADVFAGDFISTTHVRQFLKTALGGLCKRYGCAVLLLAHPSKSAMESGDGGGFSTAWNNSVRSRLYLRSQKDPNSEPSEGPLDEPSDRRMLELKKTNYGPPAKKVPLIWQHGCFVLDHEPIETPVVKTDRANTTRICVAALDYLRTRYPLVVSSKELVEALQARGDIPDGDFQERRKPVFRALKSLADEGLVEHCSTPRGYRSTGVRST